MQLPTSGIRLRRILPAAWAALALFLSAQAAEPIRVTLENRTEGPLASTAIYVTVTATAAAGGFVRMDAKGRFHPCRAEDDTVPIGGALWCDYSFPVTGPATLLMDPGPGLVGGRLYLSVGAPLHLRVDPATSGLVQPDPGNPQDPNSATVYDWMEFAVVGTGFFGNTTCVDQFGLPLSLEVLDASGAREGPVGIAERRSDLIAAWRAAARGPFRALLDPLGLRITAPGHAITRPMAGYLGAYLASMWKTYRTRPLVLTPDEGTFTGRVRKDGAIVFTRQGDPASYVIPAMPNSRQAFRCDGPLASGNALERVLGAQIGALINRHLLEDPLAWRDADRYYQSGPCNDYAAFMHRHSLGGKAYGFAYDDVNDQATLVHAAVPREITIGFRID